MDILFHALHITQQCPVKVCMRAGCCCSRAFPRNAVVL